jgi:hypothetical protein
LPPTHFWRWNFLTFKKDFVWRLAEDVILSHAEDHQAEVKHLPKVIRQHEKIISSPTAY